MARFSGKVHLPGGLVMRPMRSRDERFIETLHHSTRNDIMSAEQSDDYKRTVVELQYRMQSEHFDKNRPNADYFVLERLGTLVGRVVLEPDGDRMRILALDFIPRMRWKGHEITVLSTLLGAAGHKRMAVVTMASRSDPPRRQTLAMLGFKPSAASVDAVFDEWTWEPRAEQMA